MPPMPSRTPLSVGTVPVEMVESELPIQAAKPRRSLVLPVVESRVLASMDTANLVLTELRSRGLHGRLVRRGPEVLVRMGPFDDPREAERAAQSLGSVTGTGVTIRPLE